MKDKGIAEQERLINELLKGQDPVLVHRKIEAKVKEIFESKNSEKDHFNGQDFFEIDEVKEYGMNGFIANGGRNIGKTTAAKAECVKEVINGRRFVGLRVFEGEKEMFIRSERDAGFNECQGTCSNDGVVRDIDKNVVGGVVSITSNIGAKSIERPNVGIIVFDEFSVANPPKALAEKFVRLLTTIQRKSENVKLVMSANFVSRTDPIMEHLNFKEISVGDFCRINGIARIISIYIPDDTYNAFKDGGNIGYMMSLVNKETWSSEYATGYNDTADNIIDMTKLKSRNDMYNFIVKMMSGDLKFIIGKGSNKDLNHNDFGFIDEGYNPALGKSYVLRRYDRLYYTNTRLADSDVLTNLIWDGEHDRVKFSTEELKKTMIEFVLMQLKEMN